jgi:hypothetical protein
VKSVLLWFIADDGVIRIEIRIASGSFIRADSLLLPMLGDVMKMPLKKNKLIQNSESNAKFDICIFWAKFME